VDLSQLSNGAGASTYQDQPPTQVFPTCLQYE
jgi:hypothetical protein